MDYETLSRNYSETRIELEEAVKSLTKVVGSERSEFLIYGRKRQPIRTIAFSHYTKPCDPRKSPETSDEFSEDEPASKKVALSSTVSKAEAQKSRREVIFTQNPNLNIRSRNRRMFGIVQNTLKKFKDEQLEREPQESKRMKILEKVEAAAEEEKDFVESQKVELVSKAKEKQRKLECLQKMMRVTESFELWENNQKDLSNFILSETEPKIFFLPARLNSKTTECLKKSRDANEDKIEEQRIATQGILSRIKESYNVASFSEEKSPFKLSQSPEKHLEERDTSYSEDTLNLDINDDDDFLFF